MEEPDFDKEMLLRNVNEFLAIMPTKLPDILPKDTANEPTVYSDYAQLTFYPKKKLSLEQVADRFESQAHLVILYHKVASDSLVSWQCCCAFSNPCFRRMYKFNAMTDNNGIVQEVNVFIFEDIEKMRGALRTELTLQREKGEMKYAIDEAKLITMFI